MAAHQEQPVPEQDPWTGPQKDGLYDPQLEKEACGVGFIVAIDGKRTNKVSMRVTGWFRYYAVIRRAGTITAGEGTVGIYLVFTGKGLPSADTADVVQPQTATAVFPLRWTNRRIPLLTPATPTYPVRGKSHPPLDTCLIPLFPHEKLFRYLMRRTLIDLLMVRFYIINNIYFHSLRE